MSIKLDEYAMLIKSQIEKYSDKIIDTEAGVVVSINDGIVQVSGLQRAMMNELVEFENDSMGIVFNLEINVVGVIVLGPYENIKEGTSVKRTGQVIKAPTGDGLLGRVVNGIGMPIDGKGPIENSEYEPVEKVAPGVMTREKVNEPLETGILVIDSMFPVGKGQRELIIGDRQTGKTTLAVDIILNQKNKNVKCVYVAIGQKNSSVAQVHKILDENGAMAYTTIVSATASDFTSLQYIAPFVGVTIAEKWMSSGENVLIIYDDLSKHAVAYRTISLLLKRPPGREAYPGDIFYLHSRLLERAGKMNKENGHGSITALPVIETQANDISAYIPTNVISITDGQLFMLTSLFNLGQRPAVDSGLSVSRVGSDAQIKAIKQVSGSLKIELAQYKELEAFSQFGSELDNATKSILSHGKKVMEMIKQNKHESMSQNEEAILLFVIKYKLISFIPVENIQDFKSKLLFAIRQKDTNLYSISEELKINKEFNEGLIKKLKKEIIKFIKDFVVFIRDYENLMGNEINLDILKESD